MEEPPKHNSGITKQPIVEEDLSVDDSVKRVDKCLDPTPSDNLTTEHYSKSEIPTVPITISSEGVNRGAESAAQCVEQDLPPSSNFKTEHYSKGESPNVSKTCSIQDANKVVESSSQRIEQKMVPPLSNNLMVEPNSGRKTPNTPITCSAQSTNIVGESPVQRVDHDMDCTPSNNSTTVSNSESNMLNVPTACSTESVNIDSNDIKEEVIKAIENRLAELEDIPDIVANIKVECFSTKTQNLLCQYLDPESHSQTDGGFTRDYMGFGEWIGLDPQFMRYLHRTKIGNKTFEVLGKWVTFEDDPRPTVGNLKDCMINGIDRPDVVTDLAETITRDAIAWVRSRNEACTVPQTKTDKSWQLTRHDVVTGKKTYYTACLVYADEDEGMAMIITKLYKTVWKEALFFLPQFDLKVGKYVFDTTARVIQERCDGRVVFILSEYFFASEVCRFAVQFAKAIDASAEAGNLIPFHLTNKLDHVPTVLKGISGIRWFRPAARKMAWSTMTDTVLGGRIEPDELEKVRSEMYENVDKQPSVYLCDPPYDEGTKPPGPPIEVNDSSPPVNDSITSDSDHLSQLRTPEDLSVASKTPPKFKLFTGPRRFFSTIFNKLRKKKERPDQCKSSMYTDTLQCDVEQSSKCSDSFRISYSSSRSVTCIIQSPNKFDDIKPLSNDDRKDQGELKESQESASAVIHVSGGKTDSTDCVETSNTNAEKSDADTRQNVSNQNEVNMNFKESDYESERECRNGCPNQASVKVEFHRSRSDPEENDESVS